jgi:glycosyltransferase involved in cell wall biosynthesis
MGIRARDLTTRLPERFHFDVAYRWGTRVQDTQRFLTALWTAKPDIVYVFDMAVSGVVAAVLYKAMTRTPFVVDTGDAITALARSIGRSPVGLGLTAALEELTLRTADHIVVRGRNHRMLLQERDLHNVTVIPDGVDLRQFHVSSHRDAIRKQLGLNGDLVLGTLGSSHWNDRLQTCYGWEMLDVLDRLRAEPVQAVMIGGGDGIDRMKERARHLGLTDRIHFLGYVPYDELPSYLSAVDVGLSKQTNDRVGQVRTTGKLPLYMACGRYVLATRVGEAAHVLPDDMLIPFEGTNDPTFADRLTERVRGLLRNRRTVKKGRQNRARARTLFDYDLLGKRLTHVLDTVLSRRN